jgi:hypothetical protein
MSNFDKDKRSKVMERLQNKIKDRVTGTIYHYTKAEGFKGIIETNEIWMTNARFVNDKTELKASIEGSDIFNDIRFENAEFNKFKSSSREVNLDDYYLASFSKSTKENSLAQFRAYGNYCIGFDAKKLNNNKSSLYKCVYSIIDIKKWIVRKDKLKEWKNECFEGEECKYHRLIAFSDVLSARFGKLKNRYYESEKEVRLVAVSSVSWEFPNSPELYCEESAIYFRYDDFFNVPVPYVKFFIPKKQIDIEELEELVRGKSQIETKQIIKNLEMKRERELLPINEVIIGPMQYQEEVLRATKIFLLENGYDEVNVRLSDIPFRGK